jgi:molybdopterin-guanine dinucleotide biosynthesis protein A
METGITGVILAGGENRRFGGRIKSLIHINGQPLISLILSQIEDLFDEIIIVTNTPDRFSEFVSCRLTGDQFRGKGPLGGIHAGMTASSSQAVFVFAGDMPLLNRNIIKQQIKLFLESSNDIIIPRTGEYIEPLHSIYRKSALQGLERFLTGNHDMAVKAFIEESDVRYLDLEDSEETRIAFKNVNLQEDIADVEKILKYRNSCPDHC